MAIAQNCQRLPHSEQFCPCSKFLSSQQKWQTSSSFSIVIMATAHLWRHCYEDQAHQGAFTHPSVASLDTCTVVNLVIKRSDITNAAISSYNKVQFSWSQLFIFLCFFHPDIMRNLISQGNFHGPKVLVITRFHCSRYSPL